MLIGLLFKCVGCRPKIGFSLGGRISQERGEGGAESAGEGRDMNVRFEAYSVRGRSDGALETLMRRRFAEQRLELGLLGEMAAGGAGARGADHGTSKVRHFEGKMKKGMESLGNDVN